MVIHNDQVGFLSPLVHRGDEATLELLALLPAAKVAARIDPVPKLGVVGQKRKLVAIAGFSQLLPIANLRKPVALVDSLQNRLPLHLVNLLATKKVRPSLHEGRFEVWSKMFLQEGHILLKKLFL